MFRFAVDNDIDLRLLDLRHADALFALTDRNRAYLRPFLPWVDETTSVEHTRSFIQGGLYQLAGNNGFQAGIWFRDELVGAIGFLFFNWTNRKTEIGYWLSADAQGYGIMTRACQAMIDSAFYSYGMNRVEIHCAVDNHRSRAIPERLGFKLDGIFRQSEWLHDQFSDGVVYSMLAAEWPSRSS